MKRVINEFERTIYNSSSSCPLEDLLFLYGTIGNLYRIKGEVKFAIGALSKAVELSEGNKKLVNLIRLGEALKYAGQHQKSLSVFNGVIDQCAKKEHFQLLDFAYQHKGKCLLELEDKSQANEYFQKAMELRIKKGDESLIKSTQVAIDFVGGR
ncbi:tetratricopeptide repeat protein [Psychrobacillus sp. NPDC096623]|uniref:tetratricopeptide repeat protein n=1 Tax=Psychrobacillus sp. NPDC096623 TaxID=3364492 RepID=UPI00382FE477